jgi:cytochrome P450
MADQARMPYTNAVIHEVQRFGDIAPLPLPRITSRDIEVQDFLVTKVGLGLLLLHHDHYPTRAEETTTSYF